MEDGVGRPPEYCDDPTHNRGAAWRARRAASATSAGAAVPDNVQRPVTMAQARAGAYAEQVTSQVHTLTGTLATVLQELRTLGDPDAAAVQIEAVSTEAEQRVATAMARAAHAEQERQTAEHQRADADAAAEDANARAEALTTQLATIQEEREKVVAQVDQEREMHTAETKRLTAQITQAKSDIIELQARCDAEAAHARTAQATPDRPTRCGSAALRGRTRPCSNPPHRPARRLRGPHRRSPPR